MAQRCSICGKGPQTGMLVSHSHRRTKTRRMPNLQRTKVQTDKGPRRLRVCTRCIRSGKTVSS
ncbi:MAG: 50S ribosomal protein L28 [Armatimonadetes bacterium CG_4_10_14_3_um_filter_66_18]|nr:50S ribosomal protein L28 [Armatimonadota bacterium]OIO95221.1 MAG: 50S ribosomal protein L28 [Armatimonadetes bacterium CG2_30_66_41]PIU89678.1 MAG: 50S ribosomal protein L28 [Armatimonadetes bacterium CG06_land_8_20_14_3_00_66_21]PIX49574.1 MAG: 50S ribosomal protein L28 [Armatimonadetes bacterium CG_4_8_14_3_um_filter_66_20]PIY53145.1 MAG: 50S ribosomal protein L28 [Armatimonadetes bacterium CG_4_10_14_3_um_filter_66_18]PIZ50157.1 MAG: 50S ribosomal protein L28 [Armatimonadetes bacterium